MLREVIVDLDSGIAETTAHRREGEYGKALAAQTVMECADPEHTVYLTGYTPLAATGLGFAGKMNVYGVSLLGDNLQGSRSGGLIARHLTRLGVTGIEITGDASEQQVLLINQEGEPALLPLDSYEDASDAFALARSLYARHGNSIGFALTDPATTGFDYNAIACNDRAGKEPHRVAGRSTSRFGRNGLVAVVVEKAPTALHGLEYDKKAMAEVLKKLHKAKWNKNLTGSDDPDNPLLGGTYGGAAKARFEAGHGLTNLFRGANVPEKFYEALLPETIVREQLRLAQEKGLKITRHSCLPGCPNKCSQVVVLNEGGQVRVAKAAEWETYQGVINLGIFSEAIPFATWITEHSNQYAYDNIEALVTLAAFALATETKKDTGVRYGDAASCRDALEQAVKGETELGRLFRKGAAVVEQHYGTGRHFTVGGHALPFHNGRSLLQTGIGLSWTFGRHGESCAGPGRHNFLGDPYDPSDHNLDPRTHVLNTIHGMVLYGAVDELGMCFFIGPNIDTLVDSENILGVLGIKASARDMIRKSAQTIQDIHRFDAGRGVQIQSLPNVFYNQKTHGNAQQAEQAVAFNVPFEVIRDYGAEVLDQIARGKVTLQESILEKSRARYA